MFGFEIGYLFKERSDGKIIGIAKDYKQWLTQKLEWACDTGAPPE